MPFKKKSRKGTGQKAKSSLAREFSGTTGRILQDHWDDEPEYGFVEPPPGIRDGVARLTECKFDQYRSGRNEGKWYFTARGIILEPKELNGIKCEGRQTTCQGGPIGICDNTNPQTGEVYRTKDDNVLSILNELKKLGANTEGLGPEDLEDIASAVKEAAPVFTFSTRLVGQNNRLVQDWHGVTEFDEEETEDDVEEEEEGEDEEEETEPEDEEEEEGEDGPDSIDIDALVEKATEGDDKAEDALSKAAIEAGVPRKDVEQAPDWDTVGQLLKQAMEGSEEEEEDDDDAGEFEPDKNEEYYFKPPKGKRSLGTVTSVNRKSKTVSLRIGKKVHKGIPWSSLEY